MKILVCGAQGFIGRHICQTLIQAGHQVLSAQRQCDDDDQISLDFAIPVSIEQWEKRLKTIQQVHGGLDLIINAVGILKQDKNQSFAAIHDASPRAMFQAADRLGLRGIVQISALGPVDEHQAPKPLSAYLQSKRRADASLKHLHLPYLLLRPSLVVGADGASSKLFRTLASLPLIALPGDGEQQIQPVHVDDICAAIQIWISKIEAHEHTQITLNAVGPEAMSYRDMLQHYRDLMGLSPAWFISMPMYLMWLSAWFAQFLPQRVFAPETLRMLCQHNIANATAFHHFLGRIPIGPKAWFNQQQGQKMADEATTTWSNLVLRFSIAFVWITSGIVPLYIYPTQASYALLTSVGVAAAIAPFILISASVLDIVVGVLTLLRPSRCLWLFQIAMIFLYSLIVAARLPEFLTQPFGPITKNVPIIAVLIILFVQGKRRII